VVQELQVLLSGHLEYLVVMMDHMLAFFAHLVLLEVFRLLVEVVLLVLTRSTLHVVLVILLDFLMARHYVQHTCYHHHVLCVLVDDFLATLAFLEKENLCIFASGDHFFLDGIELLEIVHLVEVVLHFLALATHLYLIKHLVEVVLHLVELVVELVVKLLVVVILVAVFGLVLLLMIP
jgi:hypothetical protein